MNDVELKEQLKAASLEDFDGRYHDYVETIGSKAFVGLCEAFGGIAICIPTVKELTRMITYKAVLSDADRYTVKELSKKYGMQETTIYNIKHRYSDNKDNVKKFDGSKTMKELIKEADTEDFPKRYHRLLAAIGKEKLLKLCYRYSGEKIYIPMLNTVSRNYKVRKIIENPEGLSTNELAQKYGLSASTVQNIIRKNLDNKEKSF